LRIIKDTEQLDKRVEKAVLAIGNFDGVHLGHQELLRCAREQAAKIDGNSVAVTFWPHPITLNKERQFVPLQPLPERLECIARYDMDISMVLAFNREFANHTPEEFVTEKLLAFFDLKTVIIGFNHNFGRNRSGSVETMRQLGEKYGFEVIALEAIDFKDSPVSSSRIRRALAVGKIKGVNELLGREYCLSGKVVEGVGRGGKLLGFPTANMETKPRQLPLEGIYAVRVKFDDKSYMGALNIGISPTFKDTPKRLEVFLIDYDGDLYGKTLQLDFVQRLRGEKKFDSIEALKAQIAKDVQEVRNVLG